jgi:beta-glucosidase
MAVRRRGTVSRASALSPRSARGLGAVVVVTLLGTALSPSAGGVARASAVSPAAPALITAGPPALAAGPAGVEEGDVTVLEAFDGALPGSYFPWASRSGLTPALSVVTDGSAPGTGNRVLEAVVAEDTVAGDYLGFTDDTAPEDWSAADGFRFRYLGTGSGRTLSFEVKNAGRLFDQAVVDDSAGWRTVSVLFADLRLKGDPAAEVRFDPSAATGFAVTLTGLGAGVHRFDDFGLFTRSTTLMDFEGEVAIGSLATPVGVFPWSSAGATVTAAVAEEDRGGVAGHVLRGSYAVPSGGYGGISDNLAEPADWSGHGGIRFWWYASQSSNPASPTAGADIEVELKDGGPDAEHAERWTTTFKDGWGSSTSRWKLVELPFTAFAPDDYQPGAGDTLDGRLDLTRAWGTGITFAPGTTTSTGYAIDDLQLFGRPAVVTDVSVTTDRDVYLVDPGGSAEVVLRVTTRTGEPLPSPVTVSYRPGTTTTGAGAPFSGTGSVTFPAGTASGGTERVVLTALGGTDAATAASAPLVLESPGVGLPTADARLVVNAHGLPYLDPARTVAERTADLLARMTLEEKAGQMAQAERLGLTSPEQIAELGLGSLLSGGGSVPDGNTPTAWADMIDGYQRQALSTRLQIPLLYGADAVHGHSNVLGATIFPHNIGLGATRDPALVQEIAEATAAETRASGVAWAFAPCLCVSRDERWGRAYESFGEDPALVESFARANIVGLQGEDPGDMSAPDEVLASAKHWAGDGGTRYEPSQAGVGYPIDQGVTHADSLEDFTSLFVDPYLPALDAGVGTIMPSYSGVDLGDGTVRMHENRLLNTTVLKEQLGFDGFLISDWEGIDKLPGGTYPEKVVRSVNSGLDMAMAPYNSEAFIDSVTDAVGRGDIEAARVDDAVSRILSRKFALGLFDRPFADRTLLADFGGPAHRAIARRAAAESQVLLKNDGVLPLDGAGSYYVAGSNADDLGHQLGGWSIAWQGGSGDTTTGTSILEGIREVAPGAAIVHSADASAPMDGASTGIVVVGEAPYAEGVGDVGNNGNSLSLSEADRTAIDRVCGAMECVVLIVSGRPQLIADRLEGIDGLVASFLPGSEGAGVADPLFGRTPYAGRLPVTWPRTAEQVPINVGDADYDPLFPYGWGLSTD